MLTKKKLKERREVAMAQVRKGETIGGGYFVGKRHQDNGRVTFSWRPFEHATEAEATAAAARLSDKDNGQYVIVRSIGTVSGSAVGSRG